MATNTEMTPAREPGPGQVPVLVARLDVAAISGGDRGAVARLLFGVPGAPSKIFDQDTIV